MPVAVAGFAWLASKHHTAALLWLTALSLLFYASWDWRAMWILAASMVSNFVCSLAIERSSGSVSKRWLIFGVAGNLCALGIFKYAGFATEIFNDIAGTHLDRPEIRLPLAISFFTFTQIAYLVDVYRRLTVDRDPARYALFVSYFPHYRGARLLSASMAAFGLLFGLGIVSIGRASPFLYFQF
jgi:alginate O-acetyltransferase complex protein AlgI